MSLPDPERYENAMRLLDGIVAKVDRVEEQARQGRNDLWRKVHFLRVDIRRLQTDMRAWQPPAEGTGDTAVE